MPKKSFSEHTPTPEQPNTDADSLFAQSLQELSDDDLAVETGKKKKHSRSWYINRVLFFSCLAVLGVCVWEMIVMVWGYGEADRIYSDLAGEFHTTDAEHASIALAAAEKSVPSLDYDSALAALSGFNSDPAAEVTYNVEFELLRANLLNLRRKNNDLFGWISIDGTMIDYPVMKGSDNDYYLNHAYTGDFVPAGSIFADCACSSNLLDNHNLVLYGHNMSNGMMFNHVSKFLDPDFFNTHPYVVLTTTEGIFTYQVFAVYQTDIDYNYSQIGFTSHEAFVLWAREMMTNSVNHRDGISFGLYDRVLTLSTCTGSGGYWKNRYTLQAKLIKVELAE